MLNTLTRRVLVALVAGLACGMAISLVHSPLLTPVVSGAETIGALWVGAIRMTVVPDIFKTTGNVTANLAVAAIVARTAGPLRGGTLGA